VHPIPYIGNNPQKKMLENPRTFANIFLLKTRWLKTCSNILLLKYFSQVKIKDGLPDPPTGPLSEVVPSTSVEEVSAELASVDVVRIWLPLQNRRPKLQSMLLKTAQQRQFVILLKTCQN